MFFFFFLFLLISSVWLVSRMEIAKRGHDGIKCMGKGMDGKRGITYGVIDDDDDDDEEDETSKSRVV